MMRIIGDVHGKWCEYLYVAEGSKKSVQVGDFGVGFGRTYAEEEINKFHKESNGNHRFIRGNHDSPGSCSKMFGWIPDITVENDIMYVGGAWSIDYAWRREGVNWWSDEELSSQEFYLMLEVYEKTKPRIMITHDCPTIAATELFFRPNSPATLSGKQMKTRTATALQSAFEIHQPEHWFFGHWHHTVSIDVEGTKFQCLGELDYIDMEI